MFGSSGSTPYAVVIPVWLLYRFGLGIIIYLIIGLCSSLLLLTRHRVRGVLLWPLIPIGRLWTDGGV